MKTTEHSRTLAGATGSASGTPNKYDLAFLAWFARWGWQIHSFVGKIDVWTNDDSVCPFTVTRGMIDRLEWAGKIERIFPPHAAVLDYVWVLSPNVEISHDPERRKQT